MLTRALFLVVLLLGAVAPIASGAGESKVVALGLSDHEVTQEELEKGEALPPPRFNTGGVAYGLAADLKKGDAVEVALVKDGKPLHHNSETLTEDKARAAKYRSEGERIVQTLIDRYLTPAAFDALGETARAMGFPTVYSGVFVRSSFNAEEVFAGQPTFTAPAP